MADRARRFPIEVPLSYRAAGEADWRRGRTANISRSGVLFETPSPVGLDTAVELSFVLPMRSFAEIAADVICYGRVVRTQPSASSFSDTAAVAATIQDYRFVRKNDA